MADKDVAIPIRIQICMPDGEWQSRMRELLVHGDSGQLHQLIDKIPEAAHRLTRSKSKMKLMTRYKDRYVDGQRWYRPNGDDPKLSPGFTDVLDTIIRTVPLTILFQELLGWGYRLQHGTDLIHVAYDGAPKAT